MYKHSFIVYIKTYDICKDIAENVEARFDTSNYELEGRNTQIIGLMKHELCEKS